MNSTNERGVFMNQCIKCGKEIPAGELFCIECSLNPGSSMFEDAMPSERHSLPIGKMQTPKPVKRAPVQTAPLPKEKPKKHGKGLVTALVIVSLLLALSVGFLGWQYGSIQVEKNRLRTKEADLALRQTELEELQQQLNDLNLQLDEAQATIKEKEQEIRDLEAQLTRSQSSQSQGEYDLTVMQQELDRLEEENQELLALSDELELEIGGLEEVKKTLEAALEVARAYKTKAEFMDSYVVFVENNGTGYYHTYDCGSFSKSNFWAYSRKLAEAQGFTPCPTCGGTP